MHKQLTYCALMIDDPMAWLEEQSFLTPLQAQFMTRFLMHHIRHPVRCRSSNNGMCLTQTDEASNERIMNVFFEDSLQRKGGTTTAMVAVAIHLNLLRMQRPVAFALAYVPLTHLPMPYDLFLARSIMDGMNLPVDLWSVLRVHVFNILLAHASDNYMLHYDFFTRQQARDWDYALDEAKLAWGRWPKPDLLLPHTMNVGQAVRVKAPTRYTQHGVVLPDIFAAMPMKLSIQETAIDPVLLGKLRDTATLFGNCTITVT